MFSVRPTENQTRIPITVAIVLATLVLALVLSATAVFQVLDEYRMLGEWLSRPEPVATAEIRALRQEIGARIIVRSTATAVLLALHAGDPLAPAAPARHPPDLGRGQAARPRHSCQPGPGGHHDRPSGGDHEHQLGRDRLARGRPRVRRPADRLHLVGRGAAGRPEQAVSPNGRRPSAIASSPSIAPAACGGWCRARST